MKLTFRDELPQDLWPTGGDRWYAVLSICWTSPDNRWWDDAGTPDKVETRDDILLAAMTKARKEITSLMARDTDEWQWGKLHTVTLRNQTLGKSGIKPIEALFNRGDYAGRRRPGGGQRHGVRRHAGLHRDQRRRRCGCWSTLAISTSRAGSTRAACRGTPSIATTTTRPTLWATNQMWPFVSSRAAVDARTTARLELVPTG